MKKLIFLSTLFLAACGGEKVVYVESITTEPPVVETTSAPTTTQAPPATRPTLPPDEGEPPMNGYQEDVYLDYIKDVAPFWYYNYTDQNLINLGVAICEELDAGAQIDRLLIEVMIMAADVDEQLNDTVGLWMRGVVRYVCPEHYGQIASL